MQMFEGGVIKSIFKKNGEFFNFALGTDSRQSQIIFIWTERLF